MALHPLPVRLKLAPTDTVGPTGVESVSYRAEGLLHLMDWGIVLEWSETRTTERVSVERIGTDVEHLPAETVEVPFEQLVEAWVIGGWWWPQLELRARELGAFIGVPGVRGVTLRLRIHRRDRSLARAIAIEIRERAAAAELAFEERARLEAHDSE